MLPTDEPKRQSTFDRLKRDQDVRLAVGCSLFALSAIAHGVVTITIAALNDPKTSNELFHVAALVWALGLALGIIGVLIESVSGYFGSVAGQLCGGVYMFIRFRENAIGFRGIKGLEPAEYDVWAASLMPVVVWLGIAASLTVVVWIKSALFARMRRDRDQLDL